MTTVTRNSSQRGTTETTGTVRRQRVHSTPAPVVEQQQQQQQNAHPTPQQEQEAMIRVMLHTVSPLAYECFKALTRNQDTYEDIRDYLAHEKDELVRLRDFRHYLREQVTMGQFRKTCYNKGIADPIDTLEEKRHLHIILAALDAYRPEMHDAIR